MKNGEVTNYKKLNHETRRVRRFLGYSYGLWL